MRTRLALVSLAALVGLLVACSAEKSVTSGTTVDSTAATTVPADTTPTDTTPVETTPPSTTLPGPQGWTPISTSGEVGPMAYPCCGANWYGTVSPPLPTTGSTLTDGGYVVRLEWADDPTQPLVGTVGRLDRCSVLPEGSCQPADSYADDELGVDPAATMPISIPLDGSIRVVLIGFNGFEASNAAEGNGADLALLAAALDADYRAALLEPLAAGVSREDIVTGLWASGDHHFGMPAYDWEPSPSELVYTNFGAPPLLFQAAFGFDDTPADNRGVDVMGTPGISVEDGRITLYVYAGWYS